MIHIKDLGIFVNAIIDQLPNEKYLVAVDEGDCTQKEVADKIATNLGTGKSYEMNMKQALMEEDFEILYTNLRFKCSQFQKPVSFVIQLFRSTIRASVLMPA